MKIKLNKTEEIELSEREERIYNKAYNRAVNEVVVAYSVIILCAALIILFASCTPSRNFTTSQDFYQNKPISARYAAPDTITTVYHYKWHKGKLIARQDMKLVNGKWIAVTDWYAYNDNKIIHGLVKSW